MSETNNPEPVETGDDTDTAPRVTPTPQESAQRATAPRDREARYRTERNEARAERDAMAERIQRYQRSEVERLASELSEPGDVFTLSGKALSDFLAESGDVDSAAVADAVASILATRPGLSKPARPVDPTQGMGNNRADSPRWVDLLS